MRVDLTNLNTENGAALRTSTASRRMRTCTISMRSNWRHYNGVRGLGFYSCGQRCQQQMRNIKGMKFVIVRYSSNMQESSLRPRRRVPIAIIIRWYLGIIWLLVSHYSPLIIVSLRLTSASSSSSPSFCAACSLIFKLARSFFSKSGFDPP